MRKKIAYVIHSLEKAGGIERVVSVLSNELSSRPEFEICIIVLFGRSSYFEINNGVNIIYLDNIQTGGLFKKAKVLIQVVNQISIDILIGISINRLNVFLSICSFFFKHKPVLIANEHISYDNSGFFLKQVKRLLYQQFKVVCVLTEHDKLLMTKGGINNVIRIPNATSFYHEEVPPLLTRDKQIIAIGRLVHQKGFDRLLSIWAEIWASYPQWHLKIIGEGAEYVALQQIIQDKKVGNCEILPFNREIDKELEQSQIFVMSSRFEGLPMVLIEALTMGCSLISYDCPTGPREIIRNNVTGFLVEEGNREDFSKKLSMLIDNDDIRLRFSRNALEDRTLYEKKRILQQWVDLFNKFLPR